MPPAGFLDAASGEPLHPAARDVLLNLLGGTVEEVDPRFWADPQRRYGAARRTQILLEEARATIAATVGARADEVSFTSSGTEAVHRGVAGLLAGRRRIGDVLVATEVEHTAVLHAADAHEASGGAVRLVPVDGLARVSMERWAETVSEDGVAAACLQSANHEVGTRQPVTAAAALCAAAGVPLLVDAAQSIGRSGTADAGWAVLCGSARKWGGPPGLGILVVRDGTRWRPEPPTGERERGRVPGFPSAALAAAAAAALVAHSQDAETEDERLARLVERIRTEVRARVPDCEILGDPTDRLPHVVTFSCLYVDGEALLDELDRAGFSVSSGSSCTSSVHQPSHVLAAMGALTQGNIRVSLPRGVADADVEAFLDTLPIVVQRVRAALGASGL